MPDATTTIVRTLPKASTAHADFVHTRTVRHFPSSGDQRRALEARTPKARTNREGKRLKLAAPPAGRRARSAWRRHAAPAIAAPAQAALPRQHRRRPALRLRCCRRNRCQSRYRRRNCSRRRARPATREAPTPVTLARRHPPANPAARTRQHRHPAVLERLDLPPRLRDSGTRTHRAHRHWEWEAAGPQSGRHRWTPGRLRAPPRR